MTQVETQATVQEAKKALQEAKRATLRAKEKVREAQAQLLLLQDAERDAWVALQDAVREERTEPPIEFKLVKVRG